MSQEEYGIIRGVPMSGYSLSYRNPGQTAQAAPSRVPYASCHPVDRRVFSPPTITDCFCKLREASWESLKSSLTPFETMFPWKEK